MSKQLTGEDVFKYTSATPEHSIKYGSIRRVAVELYDTIVIEAPDSREKSLALTNLEQAIMWANKAVSRS